MRKRVRSHRLVTLVEVAMTVVVAFSAALAPSVATAASSPPWRFKTVTRTFEQQPGTETDWWVQCPAGYRPVSGGIAWDPAFPSGHPLHRAYEYTTQGDRTYHVDTYVSGF